MTGAEPPTTPVERALVKTMILACALALGCFALLIALIAVVNASHASRQAVAGCRLYKTVAEAPLAPQTTLLGLNLAVGARVAYSSAGCALGKLSPPDPRVAALLPAGVR